MSKKILAIFGVSVWVIGITILHLIFNREPPRKEDRFRVGFLPVT